MRLLPSRKALWLSAFFGLFSAAPVFAERPEQAAAMTDVPGLNPDVLRLAMTAVESAKNIGHPNKQVVGIIDYSLPSTAHRFWVLDLKQRKVLFRERVAHGKLTGENSAELFSNAPESYRSSLGLYVAGTTYNGAHGYSLKLHGVERGVNDNAERRAIVIHGAWYVSEEMIQRFGRIGRSWGCPAVRTEVAKRLIDSLKDGGFLFSYFPDRHWLSTSTFLRGSAAHLNGYRLSRKGE